MHVSETTVHPFELARLGIAPFRYEGMSEKVYVACPGAPEQPSGSCDYCGMGIRYCCHVRSSDGKTFIVGCDCVRKLERSDNRLISEMERGIAKINREKRDAKAAAKREVRRVERVAEEQRQRDANGGLTNAEIAAKERENAERLVAVQMETANAWLLDVLERVPYASNFVDGIKADLSRKLARDFSDKCKAILAEIYAKTASRGRRGSKAYVVKEQEFWQHMS